MICINYLNHMKNTKNETYKNQLYISSWKKSFCIQSKHI